MFKRKRKSNQEANESQAIILWHGTTMSRAQSILRKGFRASGGKSYGIFLTQRPRTALGYAESRARSEKDEPALIMCLVDLSKYKYRRSGNIYNFKHDRIGSEVVLRISDTAHIPQQNSFNPGMTLSFHSSCAAIAYWINSSPGLSAGNQIGADHPAVIAVKQWLVSQANAGKSGVVPDSEVLRIAVDFVSPLS